MIKLSVIIPTCNRFDSLKQALASLAGQTIDQNRFEVMVVDNSPSEKTAAVVQSFADRIANLRYLPEPSPGLHNARHRGMREARSDILVYIDDDIEAFSGWLEGVWEGFSRHDAVLVGGRNLPKWEDDPPEWLKRLWIERKDGERSLGYLSILDFGEGVREIDPFYVWGCNFSIRKSTLVEAGGFHPDAMPDDLLYLRGDGEIHVARFVASRGYRCMYVSAASVYHAVPKARMTVEYFCKRAFNQGVSDSYTRLRCDPTGISDGEVKIHPLKRFMEIPRLRKFLGFLLPTGVYLRASVNEAYWRGFSWHRNRFLTEEPVRSWVLRKSYLDVEPSAAEHPDSSGSRYVA